MVLIRNNLNQRLIINLKSGKSIDLLAKGTAEVSEDKFSSSHLQTLLAKGDIIVSQKEDIVETEKPKRTSYIKKSREGSTRGGII